MQVVIELDDALYRDIITSGIKDSADKEKVGDAIRVGTTLPKGHGKLIDSDALLQEHRDIDTYPFPSTTIQNAPTVIEAAIKTEDICIVNRIKKEINEEKNSIRPFHISYEKYGSKDVCTLYMAFNNDKADKIEYDWTSIAGTDHGVYEYGNAHDYQRVFRKYLEKKYDLTGMLYDSEFSMFALELIDLSKFDVFMAIAKELAAIYNNPDNMIKLIKEDTPPDNVIKKS